MQKTVFFRVLGLSLVFIPSIASALGVRCSVAKHTDGQWHVMGEAESSNIQTPLTIQTNNFYGQALMTLGDGDVPVVRIQLVESGRSVLDNRDYPQEKWASGNSLGANGNLSDGTPVTFQCRILNQ